MSRSLQEQKHFFGGGIAIEGSP